MKERQGNSAARFAGILYLGTIIAGVTAQMGVRGSLIVVDNAEATAQAIRAQESLFRNGLIADLVMLVCYVGVTALFYDMFRSVSRPLSLMAAAFSLVGICIFAANSFFMLIPLQLLDNVAYLAPLAQAQREALALMALKLHGDGYDLCLIFFGIYCLLLGWLAWRSHFIPALIGILMGIAGICYLINSIADLAAPLVGQNLPGFLMYPTLIGEAALALWLLVYGVKRFPTPERGE